MTVTVSDGTLSANQAFTWTVTASNRAPVVTSPGNQANAAGDLVSLQVAASDSDGDPLTYTATGLPAGLGIDPAAGTISGTLANSAASSAPYSVTVMASDGALSASQTFSWSVAYVGLTSPGGQANAAGVAVSLQLAATNSTGAALTYTATGLPPGLAIGSSTGLVSGTIAANADSASPYAVTVTTSDGTHSASQSFNWTVAHLTLASPGSQTGREGTAVTLQLSGTDADGDVLSYSAAGLPPGLVLHTQTGLIDGVPHAGDALTSPYTVTATASDGSHSVSQTFTWSIIPDVVVVTPGPQASADADAVALQVSASDPATRPLVYSASNLPPGLGINQATGLISGTSAATADTGSPYAATVTAQDGSFSTSVTFTWSVSHVFLANPGSQTNLDADAVSLALSARDNDHDPLSYSGTGLPAGLSINSSTGVISGAVAATADTNSPYSVTVTASDGVNTNSQSFTWTINSRFSVNSPGDQANAAGDAVSLPVQASDAANATLTYSASNLPTGLTINTSTGVISGTVAVGADSSSPYTTTVTATDGTGSATLSFTWTISAIALANPGSQHSGNAASVSLPLAGHDADGDLLTFSATGLPSGLTVNTATGVIAGRLALTAAAGSPYTITVAATDGTHTATQTFTWVVSQVSITNPGDQTSADGAVVSMSITASDVDGDALTYSASGLPRGLSIDAHTGLVSGTIATSASTSSPYPVRIAVSDGTTATSVSLNWTATPQITVAQPGDQSNREGDKVSLDVQGASAAGTLTYTARGLPTGLTIDPATGIISGSLAAGASASSPYSVAVADTAGTYSAQQFFTWTVAHGNNQAPVLTNPGNQSAHEGDVVSLQVAATDPDGDALTYSASALPDGLTMDPSSGLIYGTIGNNLASASPFTVNVTADDGNGASATTSFQWQIQNAAISVHVAPVTATEGANTGEFVVATFTDANPNLVPDDFTANVTWGGGTVESAIVDQSGSVFTVTGNYTYAHPGMFPLSVTVTDADGGSATASNTVSVATAPLSAAGGLSLYDLKGALRTYTLGSFVDHNNTDALGNYSATIDWGDASAPGLGTITGEDGTFLVAGSHSYAADGVYAVTVTVQDEDGTRATTTGTVTVGDLVAGSQASLNLSSFADDDPAGLVRDYSAIVNWGDGNPATPGLIAGSRNTFSVAGSHIFTKEGTYGVSVAVSDAGGSVINTTTTVTVIGAPLVVSANEITAAPGAAFSNLEVGTFVDANPFTAAGHYSAQISWGDGTTSTASAITGGAGLFHVFGGHTYSQGGVYALTVHVFWLNPKEVGVGEGAAGVPVNVAMQSITARLRQTRDPRTGSEPYQSFTSSTKNLVFPSSDTDPNLLVVPFKAGKLLLVGNGISPAFEASNVHWEIQTPSGTRPPGFQLTPNQQGGRSVGSPEATLTLARPGAYLVLAYLDNNEDGVYDPGDTILQVLHLVIVQADILGASNFKLNPQFFNNPTLSVSVATAQTSYDLASLGSKSRAIRNAEIAKGLVAFDQHVHLGGFSNGRLGLGTNNVTLGWVQDVAASTVRVDYLPTGHADLVPSSPVRGPWLDSDRSKPDIHVLDGTGIIFGASETPGTGGITAFTRSWTQLVFPPFGGTWDVGQWREVISLDAPGINFEPRFPTDIANIWDRTSGTMSYATYLVMFSSNFNRNYTVLGRATWSITWNGRNMGDNNNSWKDNGAIVESSNSLTTYSYPIPGSDESGFQPYAPTWKAVTNFFKFVYTNP